MTKSIRAKGGRVMREKDRSQSRKRETGERVERERQRAKQGKEWNEREVKFIECG